MTIARPRPASAAMLSVPATSAARSLASVRFPASHAERAAARSVSGSLPLSPRVVTQSRGAAAAAPAATTADSEACVLAASAEASASSAAVSADS